MLPATCCTKSCPGLISSPLDGWSRWLVPTVALGAALTFAVFLLLLAQPWFAAAAVFGGLAAFSFLHRKPPGPTLPDEPLVAGPDYSLVGSALGLSREPTSLTTSEGSLLIMNAAYRERFGGTLAPLDLAADDQARQGLQLAKSMAWRDGAGCVTGISTVVGLSPVEVERVGSRSDLLLWRFPDPSPQDPLARAAKGMDGIAGARLASAGIMGAVIDGKGKLLAANRTFRDRAAIPQADFENMTFGELVAVGEDQRMRLVTDGEGAVPLRAVHVPASAEEKEEPGHFCCSRIRKLLPRLAPQASRPCWMSCRSALLWSIATAAS